MLDWIQLRAVGFAWALLLNMKSENQFMFSYNPTIAILLAN